MPTSPPHVRVPISFPAPDRLKYHGIASPPEPARSLINITFGPNIPCGCTGSAPIRFASADIGLRFMISAISVASSPPPLNRSSIIAACLPICA